MSRRKSQAVTVSTAKTEAAAPMIDGLTAPEWLARELNKQKAESRAERDRLEESETRETPLKIATPVVSNIYRDTLKALQRYLTEDLRAFVVAAVAGHAEVRRVLPDIEAHLESVAERSASVGITEETLPQVIPVTVRHRSPRTVDPKVAKTIAEMRRQGCPKALVAKAVKKTSAWVSAYLRNHDDPAPAEVKARELAVRKKFFEKLLTRAQAELA